MMLCAWCDAPDATGEVSGDPICDTCLARLKEDTANYMLDLDAGQDMLKEEGGDDAW